MKLKKQTTDDLYLDGKNGMFLEAWGRLKCQPTAMISLAIVILLIFVSFSANLLFDYDTVVISQNISEKFLPVSFEHFLGTDQFGRDQFARVIHGVRSAMIMGVCSSLIATFIGTVLACVAAYYGGKADLIIMRCVDVLATIPAILLAIAICAGLGTGMWQLIVAISMGGIANATRMIRSKAINVTKMEYIESAQALGVKTLGIMIKYVCPNILSMLIITFTAMIGNNIMTGATLSFIGLGVKSPQPEWGLMLNEAIPNIRLYVNLVVGPAVGIIITTLSINTLGDCLRDAFDPQLKGKF